MSTAIKVEGGSDIYISKNLSNGYDHFVEASNVKNLQIEENIATGPKHIELSPQKKWYKEPSNIIAVAAIIIPIIIAILVWMYKRYF